MITIKDGHWYRSKEALARSATLRLIDAPHVTPDGYAVLVFDLRGVVPQPVPDGPTTSVVLPPAMVMQADHGHDLLQVVTNGLQPRIERVEFPLGDLADLEPLIEYDHLPSSRQDYSVYPRGHKLASN